MKNPLFTAGMGCLIAGTTLLCLGAAGRANHNSFSYIFLALSMLFDTIAIVLLLITVYKKSHGSKYLLGFPIFQKKTVLGNWGINN